MEFKSNDPDWAAKVEALSQEVEAIRLRKALDKAFAEFLEFYSARGVVIGVSVTGENTPKRCNQH